MRIFEVGGIGLSVINMGEIVGVGERRDDSGMGGRAIEVGCLEFFRNICIW